MKNIPNWVWWLAVGLLVGGAIAYIYRRNRNKNSNGNGNGSSSRAAVRCCTERDENCNCTAYTWVRSSADCEAVPCRTATVQSTPRPIISTTPTTVNGGGRPVPSGMVG